MPVLIFLLSFSPNELLHTSLNPVIHSIPLTEPQTVMVHSVTSILGIFYLLVLLFEVFILLRCIVAFFSMSVFNCGFCYCMEIVGGRAATIVGIGLEIPWFVAFLVFSSLRLLPFLPFNFLVC